jgi:hypothetical protein
VYVQYGAVHINGNAGPTTDIYRLPRSPIVTSLLNVVPESGAKQLVAAPIKAKWKFVNIKTKHYSSSSLGKPLITVSIFC